MANLAKSAILRALIEGAITDLMVKTNAANVYVDENTTLAAKLTELITSLNAKASTSALESGLNARPTTEAMNSAISAAISDLIDGAPGTYDTLKELADYINEHQDVVTSLNEAIGSKADANTVAGIKSTVDALGALSKYNLVTEELLGTELKAKVNAASEGNHSHENKSVLDNITDTLVSSWNSKSRFYAQATQPADMANGDLWAQII